MAMPIGVRGFNPVWTEVDLVGKLFDDTFYMYVLQNTIPYLPATVYHDPNLATAWTNPIQFLGNGTLPVDIYFEPSVVYRLEFRQNNGVNPPSQADALIYEVNNYIAGSSGQTPVDTVAFASSNQITNPQFAILNFSSPFSLVGVTNPAPIEIGPGWFLELTGTGNAVLQQVPLSSTTTPNPSNAPYALRLTLSGWDVGGVVLRQRFYQNGVLWANQYVSSAITARIAAAPQAISATLVDSNNTILGFVLNSVNLNTEFNQFRDYLKLEASTNPDVPPVAYIDYKLFLPSNADIYVTSIQVVVQDLPVKPSFEQDSINRQIDHTFNYYLPQLSYKEIPSYLVGWDFPLNPAQFGETVAASAIGANKSKYVWDQTIVFQSANSGVGVTRGSAGELLLTAAATTQMAVIQYLDATTAKKILNAPMCVHVSAKASAATTATVTLWYTTDVTLPNIAAGTNNSLVTSLDANGVPTVSSVNWLQVPRSVGNAQFIIGTNATTNFNEYSFTGWDMAGIAASNTATFFAIVVGTASVTIGGTVGLNSVSLQAGYIPTKPAPQTYSDVLRECQYYYEKSYQLTDSLGAVTKVGAMFIPQCVWVSVAGNAGISASPFYFDFVPKRLNVTSATIAYYTPNAGTAGSGDMYIYYSNAGVFASANTAVSLSTNWTATYSHNRINYQPITNTLYNPVAGITPGNSVGGGLYLHWFIDQRLGIV